MLMAHYFRLCYHRSVGCNDHRPNIPCNVAMLPYVFLQAPIGLATDLLDHHIKYNGHKYADFFITYYILFYMNRSLNFSVNSYCLAIVCVLNFTFTIFIDLYFCSLPRGVNALNAIFLRHRDNIAHALPTRDTNRNEHEHEMNAPT